MAQQETLRISAGAQGLTALIGRAVGLDAAASARLKTVAADAVDVFVTTPFDCIASRRVRGQASRDGAVVSAGSLLAALRAGVQEIGVAQDQNWPGALPPVDGFVLRETIPVSVVRKLADEGRSLARQFSGPKGPPVSLLDSAVITVSDAGRDPLEIPMRMVFTCTSLGLIPGFDAPIEIPRHMRVATAGRWVRLDAPFGSVYRNTGLGLFT